MRTHAAYPLGNFRTLKDADAFCDESVVKIKELPDGQRVRLYGSVYSVDCASINDKGTAAFTIRWNDGTYESMFPSEFKRCHRRHVEATQAAEDDPSGKQGAQ